MDWRRRGTIAWPTRSLDLTSLNYNIWKYMKSFVYITPINFEQDLIQRIILTAYEMKITFSSGITKTEF